MMNGISINDIERIYEKSFKDPDYELDDAKIYVVKGGANKPYIGVSKGNDRQNTGITSDLLERDLPVASAYYGISRMRDNKEGCWSITKGGQVEQHDNFSTVYTSSEFLCGGYANSKIVLIFEKTQPNKISGFLIKPDGDRYTTIDSKESIDISTALCETPDILEALGLGKLVGREKKGRTSEYIIA